MNTGIYAKVLPVTGNAFAKACRRLIAAGEKGDVFGVQANEVRNILVMAAAAAEKLAKVPYVPENETHALSELNTALHGIIAGCAVLDGLLVDRRAQIKADTRTVKQVADDLTKAG